jgi:galactose-1-phosphate uridylyltransferase
MNMRGATRRWTHQLKRAHKNAERAAQQAACGYKECVERISARKERMVKRTERAVAASP